MNRERLMSYELDNDIIDQYDFVFIDCSPSLGLLTVNAMVAADKLLVPLIPNAFSLDGVNYLMTNVYLNKDLVTELDYVS
jgi:chromosome partitioning protein